MTVDARLSERDQARSERRARALQTWLENAGIAPARLSALGKDSAAPIGPAAHAARIEIVRR
jgi:outer membrane protein OmpA-like peptidoglycan-associated protein